MPEFARDTMNIDNSAKAFWSLSYNIPSEEEEDQAAWQTPSRERPIKREYFENFKKVRANTVIYSELSEEFIGGLSRVRNAFTQTGTIENKSREAKEIISHFQTLKVSFSSVLSEGLLRLFDLAKEEEPDCAGISSGSLKSFFNFLQVHPYLKRPEDLALTPGNNIYISWRSGEDKVFSIEFAPHNMAHFVVFAQNKLNPEVIDRVSGSVSAATLMQSVEPYNVSSWVSDERE
jgi:hypothetical protein